MQLDTNILFFLNGFAGISPWLDSTIVFFASYLPWLLVAIFMFWLYFSSSPKKEKLYIFWVAIIAALVARFGITELIRFLYHRPRPFMAYQQIHALFVDNEWSFPSGHATFFFAIASAVFLYNRKWGVGFFVAALIITISRVIAGVHYPSDIVGGMLVGIAVAYAVFYVAEKWRAKEIEQ